MKRRAQPTLRDEIAQLRTKLEAVIDEHVEEVREHCERRIPPAEIKMMLIRGENIFDAGRPTTPPRVCVERRVR
jgi:hypothetical protein